MSAPSSPAPSSASDDFAALLDADLQTSLDECEEYSEDGIEEADMGIAGVEEETEQTQELLSGGEAGEGQEEEEVEEDAEEDENARSNYPSQLGKDSDGTDQYDVQEEYGRGKRKREWEEDDSQSDTKSVEGKCPPHPGFINGMCYLCGENIQDSNSEPKPVKVQLRYIHEGLEVTEREAARMRRDELKHAMIKQKLYLVLDLDHTMLNSARFIEVHPDEEAHLAACYSTGPRPREGGLEFTNGLHRLNQLQMWTKLRPFAHEFIEAASKICEVYVYTMGERAYAVAMARLLDPTGRFFGDRIISQGDSTRSTMKDLDVVLGAESAVVILDDTEGVWPKHRANLILMERYHFFRSSCRQFGIRGLSLTERRRDESEQEGALANALKTLRSVHQGVFGAANLVERGSSKWITEFADVRKVIQSLKMRILQGCRVVFSRIFPIGMPHPETHPFWRLTAELGAQCSTTSESEPTHVIALDRGTDKARWAKRNGKYLVHPCWVEAAQSLWRRPMEEDFPVGEGNLLPPQTSFAKTVDVMQQQSRPETSLNGIVEDFHAQLLDGIESGANSGISDIKVPSQRKEGIEVLGSPKSSNHIGTSLQAITS